MGRANGNYHRCEGIYTKMQSARRINIQNAAKRQAEASGDKPGPQTSTDDNNWRVIINEYLHNSINLSVLKQLSTLSVLGYCKQIGYAYVDFKIFSFFFIFIYGS